MAARAARASRSAELPTERHRATVVRSTANMLKNLIVLVSLVWCARGDVCDAQDSTAPSVVGCTSTVTPGEDGPCAHAYMKKMSSTGLIRTLATQAPGRRSKPSGPPQAQGCSCRGVLLQKNRSRGC